MALIGPRPERPAFCAEFEKRIHGWNYRILVKPGLSDLAQVRGGYDLLPKEKVALDLWRAGYPSLRIALVTDPPHSSIISTALRLCSSVQLGIRELLTGPIGPTICPHPHLSRMQRRDVQLWLSLRNLPDRSVVPSNYLVDTR